jgi:hypothetical protein
MLEFAVVFRSKRHRHIQGEQKQTLLRAAGFRIGADSDGEPTATIFVEAEHMLAAEWRAGDLFKKAAGISALKGNHGAHTCTCFQADAMLAQYLR